MLPTLLLLFILMPVVELALLIKIGTIIGGWKTVALVIAIGVAGAWLVRHEGRRAWRAIQEELGAGRLPTDRMIDGMLILVAGILMITPGVITDAVGLALLIPPARALVRERLKKRFKPRVVIMHPGFVTNDPNDGFIDVQARVIDEPRTTLEPPAPGQS